jgi:hypothetical protein
VLTPSRRCTSTLALTLLGWVAGPLGVTKLLTDCRLMSLSALNTTFELMLSRSLYLEGSAVLTLVKDEEGQACLFASHLCTSATSGPWNT